MTIAKAISDLREHMGITQRELAEKLGTRTETISRWEKGHRRPTRDAMERLAILAHQAGNLKHLRNYFAAEQVVGIVNRIKRGSPGSERHIPLKELKFWSAYLRETASLAAKALGQPTAAPNRMREMLLNDVHVMRRLCDRIELYIDEEYSSARLQEDSEILRWGYRQGGFTKGDVGE